MVRQRASTVNHSVQGRMSYMKADTPSPVMKFTRAPTRTSVKASPTTTQRADELINKLPLRGQMIVLDIDDIPKQNELKNLIMKLGGATEEFISEDPPPFLVVSDHHSAKHLERLKVHKIDRVDPDLMRRLPVILKDAVRLKVRVRFVTTFEESIVNASQRMRVSRAKTVVPNNIKATGSIKALKTPYIKIEDATQNFCPVHKELDESGKNYGQLYFGQYLGTSMFHKATAEVQERRLREMMQEELHERRRKELGLDEYYPPELQNSKKPAPKVLTKGFCEICGKHSQNIKAHLISKEHLAIINTPGFYDEVDALMGSYVDHITCPSILLLKREPPPVTPPKKLSDKDTYEYC